MQHTPRATPSSQCLSDSHVLDFKDTGSSVVQFFAPRASSHCKHDMSALNAKTLERVPTLLFGRLVRCSVNGCSFARLQYMYNTSSYVENTM